MILTLDAVIHFFSQDTLAYDDVSSDQESYFDHMSPRCDIDLENSNSNNINFRMTLWLTMLHHHTKFGNKMACDSENIIRTNIP